MWFLVAASSRLFENILKIFFSVSRITNEDRNFESHFGEWDSREHLLFLRKSFDG
jgi:hypothetical protein